jgi:Protein of unknown function TPD sequence-motif
MQSFAQWASSRQTVSLCSHDSTHLWCSSVIGLEYEYVLYEKLRNRNVPFSDEEDLRRQGHMKTPDVKLPVPIGR